MLLWGNAILPFEAIRIVIAFLGVAIGSYFDLFNNKNIPETFLYGFLIVAFIANLAAFDEVATPYAIATTAIIFGAFYMLYKAGQIGGADVYIMSSIALLLPIQPKISPFLHFSFIPELPFIISIILASGISLMIYMLLRSIPIAIKYLSTPTKLEKKALFGSVVILIAFTVFSYVALQSGLVPQTYFLFISVMVIFAIYFTVFKQAINDTMIEWTDYKHVEPEDIIAIDRMDAKIVKQYSLSRLVDVDMHSRMKKIHGKKIALYKNLPPFIPHILIGLAASILFGNIILFFSGF